MSVNDIAPFIPTPKTSDADRVAEIKKLYAAGDSSTVIGSKVGCAAGTVLAILRREGVEIRKVWSRHPESEGLIEATPETIAAIGKAYTDGASTTELSKHYGISAWSVLKALRSAGIAIRPRGVRPIVSAAKVEEVAGPDIG